MTSLPFFIFFLNVQILSYLHSYRKFGGGIWRDVDVHCCRIYKICTFTFIEAEQIKYYFKIHSIGLPIEFRNLKS